MLHTDARSFATVRWAQHGVRRAYGAGAPGTTTRNMFGQVDGTTNPKPGTTDFDTVIWAPTGWLTGRTSLVIRRTHIDLDEWDRLDRAVREQSVGRTFAYAAPLAGTREHDETDSSATTGIGFPVIPEFSHLRRALREHR